jgi:deazaflavin-dependent oxidoreductase (nitroreductase family)
MWSRPSRTFRQSVDERNSPKGDKEARVTQTPALIRWSGPIANRLLGVGMPMGPNRLLTVSGRKSGEPRSAPVAVIDVDGRWWVVGTFGETHWVRNLRAAGEATLRIHGRPVRVAARELDRSEAVSFYSVVLPAYLGRMPRLARPLLRTFIGQVAPEVFSDPVRAAASRPVFELLAQNGPNA